MPGEAVRFKADFLCIGRRVFEPPAGRGLSSLPGTGRETSGSNGLELQHRIGNEQRALPIIFITGHVDIPMTVSAMKAGAVEFLTKPFSADELLAAIRSAVERSRAFMAEYATLRTLKARYHTMSPRECEVMSLVIRGQLNKQIAVTLGISEVTVKAHRGQVMRKMHAKSLAQLITMAALLEEVS